MAMEICATGMVSGLASTAEGNAALMRLEYDCFQKIPFQVPETGEDLVGGIIEFIDSQGVQRLVDMADIAIRDAISSTTASRAARDIIICLPKRAHEYLDQQLQRQFNALIIERFKQMRNDYGCDIVNEHFYLHQGRTGFTDALVFAQERFSESLSEQIIIVGVDSLINNESISMLLGASGSDYPGRLVVDGNPDGMFVGEASAAIIVKQSAANLAGFLVTGVGVGHESATLGNFNEVNRADGLVTAVNQATAQAGIKLVDTDYRIAGVTGESYFFNEDSTLIYRCINTPKEHYDIWHTADKIGEVGSATGPVMATMAFWAAKKHYAPGHRVLCHMSTDDERRSAFILENNTG